MPLSDAAEKFWSNVEIRGLNECWPWKGGKCWGRYGGFYTEGASFGAHRVAFELVKGPLGVGMKVCHTCDNPPCCNPVHLFEGTQKRNMQDCSAKGRAGCGVGSLGEKNGWSKLTDWQVVGVMARLLTCREKQTEVAASLGVNKVTVSSIWLGKTWSHLFS